MSIEKVLVSNSDIVVKKLSISKKPFKGADWFDNAFANIFLLARKNSGKSTVVANIIEHMSGKDTSYIFVCSTVDKDPVWVDISKRLEKKGASVITETSLVNDDDVHIIEDFLQVQTQISDKPVNKILPSKFRFNQQIISVKPITVTDKTKFRKLNYIIALDDLGEGLRDKPLTQLLKTNRHHKSMVIISSQSLKDLTPSSINQLDYILLFGQIPIDRLSIVVSGTGIDISFEDFLTLYNDATSKKYGFLYVDIKNSIFRDGFTFQYVLSN